MNSIALPGFTCVYDPMALVWLLGLALAAFVLGAAALAPVFAFYMECLAAARKKAAYKKLGKQATTLSLTLGLPALVGLGACAALGSSRGLPLPSGPALPLYLPAALALVLALVFLLPYHLTWKSSKQRPTLHRTLGLLAALCCLGTLVYALAATRAALLPAPPAGPTLTELAALPAAELGRTVLATLLSLTAVEVTSHFWPVLALSLVAALASSCLAVLCYLPVRRVADDFGRDYYILAASTAARWAFWLALVTAACLIWSTVSLLPLLGSPSYTAPSFQLLAGALLGCLLAAVSCLPVFLAAQPMRQKHFFYLALLCYLLGLGCMGGVLLPVQLG